MGIRLHRSKRAAPCRWIDVEQRTPFQLLARECGDLDIIAGRHRILWTPRHTFLALNASRVRQAKRALVGCGSGRGDRTGRTHACALLTGRAAREINHRESKRWPSVERTLLG